MAIFGNNNIQHNAQQLRRTGAIESKVGSYAVLPTRGGVSKITAYVQGNREDGRCAIYNDSGRSPNVLQGSTITNAVPIVPAWVDFIFAAPLRLEAGIYWLAFFSNGEPFIFEDAGGGFMDVELDEWNDGFSNPFGGVGPVTVNTVSIYGTYTALPSGQKAYNYGLNNVFKPV